MKSTVLNQIRDYRQRHPNRDMPFDELQHSGTIAQLHEALVSLARQKVISLRPWTGSRSDLEVEHDAEYALRVEYAPGFAETKFYARLES